jgi:putative membrane protein
MVGLLGATSVLARFGGQGMGRGGGPLWIMPIMGFLMIVVAVLFILFIYWLVRTFYRTEMVPRKPVPETPLMVAERRYAAGEITAEDFDKIKQRL